MRFVCHIQQEAEDVPYPILKWQPVSGDSMNWFKGKSAGNPCFHPQNYGCPVDVSLPNQFKVHTVWMSGGPYIPLAKQILAGLCWITCSAGDHNTSLKS